MEVLACPDTGHPLEIGSIQIEEDGEIQEGILSDCDHNRTWPIHNFIPRFITGCDYTRSFGYQWARYRRTQLDRFNGTMLTRDRFQRETGWTVPELQKKRVLDAGCGAGRYSQVMLDAGARVCAVDSATAVDACWRNLGPHPNLLVVQADLHSLPFARSYFDKVFCYGVLHHTPDAERVFKSLLPALKSGGEIFVSVYAKYRGVVWSKSKYWWRPVAKRLPPALLARLVEWYVPRWLPVDTALRRIPWFGRFLSAIVPCWNYTGVFPLTSGQIRDWAILDTFDALSAWYDRPQKIAVVRSWFEDAGLEGIRVEPGGIGIIGSGRKPWPQGGFWETG